MSTFTDPVTQQVSGPLAAPTVNRRGLAGVAALSLLAIVVGLLAPDVTGDAGTMTHYMGLLAANQPWNLIVFMAIPVILAETLAISELVILFHQGAGPRVVHRLSRWAGIAAGPWFLGITTYLLGLVPLFGITLIEFGVLGRNGDRARMRLHATFVGIFLVVAHVAMIFGMLDPTLVGWTPAPAAVEMPANMPGM
jgi:hypothetical protein